MLETHPYGNFVPPKAKFLLLGSFVGRPEPGYDWFYSSKRNQFWSILERVYDLELGNRKNKQDLFRKLKMAVADIIYQCERQKGNNLDNNLVNIVYNTKGVNEILGKNKIEKIFFSSRYVEAKFKRLFKEIQVELVTLPSPSPRYARLSKEEKIKRYKDLLPRLK